MREESEELKCALSSMRSGVIALHANVLLAQQVVLPNSSAAQVSEDLQVLAKNQLRELIVPSLGTSHGVTPYTKPFGLSIYISSGEAFIQID